MKGFYINFWYGHQNKYLIASVSSSRNIYLSPDCSNNAKLPKKFGYLCINPIRQPREPFALRAHLKKANTTSLTHFYCKDLRNQNKCTWRHTFPFSGFISTVSRCAEKLGSSLERRLLHAEVAAVIGAFIRTSSKIIIQTWTKENLTLNALSHMQRQQQQRCKTWRHFSFSRGLTGCLIMTPRFSRSAIWLVK